MSKDEIEDKIKHSTPKLRSVTVNFKTADGKAISSKDQAELILEVFRNEIKNHPNMQVALIFSENCRSFSRTCGLYLKEKYYTNINGANQAAVIREMEELSQNNELAGSENYLDLQNKIFYLGITTCKESGGIGAVPREYLISSLANICCFLGSRKVLIYGWKNQKSGKDFAVGGGISQVFTKEESNWVQDVLHVLEENPDELNKLPAGAMLEEAYQLGQVTGNPRAYIEQNIQRLQEQKAMGEIPSLDVDTVSMFAGLTFCNPANLDESTEVFNSDFFKNEKNELTLPKDTSSLEDLGTIDSGFDPFPTKNSSALKEKDKNTVPLSKSSLTLTGKSLKRKKPGRGISNTPSSSSSSFSSSSISKFNS